MYKNVIARLRQSGSVYLGILLGTIEMAAALSIFLVPFKIAPGGVSGLATVLYYITQIRVSTLILIINAPIFILGFITFNASFLRRSIFGTIALSVSAELFSYMPSITQDTLLACVIGGALMGCGIATVLRFGGTTGGTDILVLVIQKYFPRFSVGQLFLLIDGVIIAMAGAVLGDLEVILYSAAALFISTRVTDAILEGIRFAKMVYIISTKCDQITQRIYAELGRGVTGMLSVSMYTGASGKVLLCAIRKYELIALKKIVYSTDENAFVIISDAKEIMGNGFGEINN